ncbi:polynucleotide 5'-hydroxyl-kinase NOL9-like [Pecten maximus]|uniref:polynucleotide 5'-hydroxyl-kinase NOL9-like n=1 Tax=Pecten maximus TaxID=6579 RepID=UPI001458B545|nr:polynucleotide 5'-hydroxyl-kinase NOL9-like [Pecten maximus]
MDKYAKSFSKSIETESSKVNNVEVIEMVKDGSVQDGASVRNSAEKCLQDEVTETRIQLKKRRRKRKAMFHESPGRSVNSPRSRVESPESAEENARFPSDGASNFDEVCNTLADCRTADTAAEFQFERLIDVKEGRLLILESEQEVCVTGLCKMSVLCGSAGVFGYHCDPSKQPVRLFSAVSNSLLKIKCLSVESNPSSVRSIYSKYKLAQDILDELPSRGVAVVKLDRLHAPHIDYLTSLNTFKQLFCGIKDGPQGMFSIESKQSKRLPQLELSKDYYYVLDKWKEQLSIDPASIVITCGGKDQGKSTLTQFLLNSTLNVLEKVCYLDCDPGQTEFTPPGSVSLHTITTPALGPPFTQQREPTVWCFNGNVTPSGDPHLYLRCISHCFRAYMQMKPRPPLVVNTMGYITGLGLRLLIDTLKIVQPDLVIQIDSKHMDGNLPALTAPYVSESEGWSNHCRIKQQENIPQKDHSLVILDSVVKAHSSGQSRSRQHREMALLCYLAAGLPEGILGAKPCMVSWSSIAIHVCHETVPSSQILEAINACVVALCCLDDEYPRYKDGEESPWLLKETPVCDCVGYGFVRGVDRDKKCVCIVSPVPLSKLKSVNLLMRGNVNLSEDLFLKVFQGVVPYVDNTATATGGSALRQRKRLPRINRGRLS